MGENRPLSTLVIRDLIFDTLSDDNFCRHKTEEMIGKGYSFQVGGLLDNLYWIMELKAIDKGLIKETKPVRISAWGSPRDKLVEWTSNFNKEEIEKIYDTVYLLLNQGIIAPGKYNHSYMLPYFHITPYGKKCIKEKDILPYDIDGFTKKIQSINNIDEWVEFYLLEAMRCYNANCYNATTVMIGLASEKLVELLIESVSDLLSRKVYCYNTFSGTDLKTHFDNEISKNRYISNKFECVNKFIKDIEDNNKKKVINNILNKIIDEPARNSFMNFTRLNRNEVSHCADIKKDNTETMLLFMSFLKYCEKMSKAINDINNLK